MLVAGDVYRPAAIDQLVILGEQVTEFDFLEVYQFQFLEQWTLKKLSEMSIELISDLTFLRGVLWLAVI